MTVEWFKFLDSLTKEIKSEWSDSVYVGATGDETLQRNASAIGQVSLIKRLLEAKVVEIDAQVKESITDQLFAICELPTEKCNAVNSPKAEVANFGWSKIEAQWEVDGVTIYKLIHNYPDNK